MPSNGLESVGGVDGDAKNDDGSLSKVDDTVTSAFNKGTWTPLAILFAALSFLLAYYFAKENPSASLPEIYALCSRHNNKVYTVDEKNSQTQCIVVNGAYIVDTGSLGEFTC